jgi:hypothetical protein
MAFGVATGGHFFAAGPPAALFRFSEYAPLGFSPLPRRPVKNSYQN